MLTYLLSLGAGSLTALSPCILPVLPIMAGGSMTKRKSGPLFIALGLVSSLVVMGLLFSSVTSLLGLSEEQVRISSAWMLLIFGLFLAIPFLRNRLNAKLEGFGNTAMKSSSRFSMESRIGQFGIGFLMGAAWSPCVGPTLGVALGLAGSKAGLAQASMMMLMFGIGLSLPLLGISYGLRKFVQSKRTNLMQWNRIGTHFLGGSLAMVGLLMISGFDKVIEAQLSSSLPTWFLELSSFI